MGAAVSTELVFTSKKKKEKAAKGLSEKEVEDMEKLKQNIMTKKSELKAEGMSGGQINKDSEIVDWVAKLNALKEKELKQEAKGKKGDDKEIAKLKQDIEDYKLKLKEEFGYTKQEINKDPDLMDMQKRYKEIGGK